MIEQTAVLSDIKIPPGVKILCSSNKVKGALINFTYDRPTTPLPPLVQAYFTNVAGSKAGVLQVSAFAFIDSSAKLDKLNPLEVYQNVSNEGKLEFYFAYDAPETKATEFIAYQINFNVALESKPQTIEAFVWDVDPDGSRGTEVNVGPI